MEKMNYEMIESLAREMSRGNFQSDEWLLEKRLQEYYKDETDVTWDEISESESPVRVVVHGDGTCSAAYLDHDDPNGIEIVPLGILDSDA